MYQKILVALDGSELAEGTLPLATAVASGADASLTLIAVVEPGEPVAGVARPASDTEGPTGRAVVDVGWQPPAVSQQVARLARCRSSALRLQQ